MVKELQNLAEFNALINTPTLVVIDFHAKCECLNSSLQNSLLFSSLLFSSILFSWLHFTFLRFSSCLGHSFLVAPTDSCFLRRVSFIFLFCLTVLPPPLPCLLRIVNRVRSMQKHRPIFRTIKLTIPRGSFCEV